MKNINSIQPHRYTRIKHRAASLSIRIAVNDPPLNSFQRRHHNLLVLILLHSKCILSSRLHSKFRPSKRLSFSSHTVSLHHILLQLLKLFRGKGTPIDPPLGIYSPCAQGIGLPVRSTKCHHSFQRFGSYGGSTRGDDYGISSRREYRR